MPKGIVVTMIGNRIEWADYQDEGGLLTINGKREDVTDSVIKAMFQHMQGQFNANDKAQEKGYFAYGIKGVGELRFTPHEKETQD